MADLRASGLGGVPKGATADRPASPSIGDVFYNGTNGMLEIYTAMGWTALAGAPPATPVDVIATNSPASRAYNNGSASIAFTAGSGGGIPVDYLVTPTPATSPSSFTGSSSPVIVTGLASSTQYTYTVAARNNFGNSFTSLASSAVTATTVPQAPTINSVTDGGTGSSISVAFSANATGGSSITGYTITSSPENITATGSSSPITVTGLTGGTSYTFTATATNANGTSAASSASSSISPAQVVSVETLAVAGGASAGEGYGGGGGAGGVKYTSAINYLKSSLYTVTVGAGGAAITGNLGNNGSDSNVTGPVISLTAAVGGGGGGANVGNGKNGGSGGGGGGFANGAGAGTSGQGNDGGAGSGSAPGGGGGAGAAGGRPSGGVGTSAYSSWGAATSSGQNVSGTYYYAGGGSAATGGGTGGSGGGGNVDTAATANTGGGGGGNGKAGGSGIVILRTLDSVATASSHTGTLYTTGGYKYYKFTSTGSITF